MRIETNGAVGGWSAEAADFCRFLAYSGCRVGEVAGVTWACVDCEKKQLHVKGVMPVNLDHNALKTESSDRFVPLFAARSTAEEDRRATKSRRGLH